MDAKDIRMDEIKLMQLFKDNVGSTVREKLSSDRRLASTSEKIVKECAGLPLAIVTIAGSLRGSTDHDTWELLLENLKKCNVQSKEIQSIIDALKLSFDRLNGSQKNCLLYCALFPEDNKISVEFLIELLIAEGMIEREETRQSETRRGREMVRELQDACLLNGSINHDGKKFVKMHDLVRDMAIQIAGSESYRYLVKSIPDEDKRTDNLTTDEDKQKDNRTKDQFTKVSLINSALSSGPPKTRGVLTLFLHDQNYEFKSIPNEFFLHMEGLSVLNLSLPVLVRLPESISDLVSLIALSLRKCSSLIYVPSLAKLKKLRKLDFYHSGIKLIPDGLDQLVNLKYLNFDRCPLLIMPSRVLRQLTRLEYLVLPRWRQGPKIIAEDLEQHTKLDTFEGPKVKAEDLQLLTKLETFEGVFYDINNFNAYIRCFQQERQLVRYKIHFGYSNYYVSYAADQDHNRIVHLTGNLQVPSTSTTTGECLLSLPKDVDVLAVHHCRTNASSLCNLTDASELRLCNVEDCGGLEYLFSYSSQNDFPLLPMLERLILDGVSGFRGLIKTERAFSLPDGSFSTLKELSMCNCNSVKTLFVFKVSSLPNLQELTLSRCEQLEAIVPANEDEIVNQDENVITVPKLKRFVLFKLPKLRTIPLVAVSLEEIHIEKCPELRNIDPLLDSERCPTSLIHVYIDKDTWKLLEWKCHYAKDFVVSLMNPTHDLAGEEALASAAIYVSPRNLQEEEREALFRRNLDIVLALLQWNLRNLEEVIACLRQNFDYSDQEAAAALFRRNLEEEELEEVAIFFRNLDKVLFEVYRGIDNQLLIVKLILGKNLRVEVCFNPRLEVTSLFWDHQL